MDELLEVEMYERIGVLNFHQTWRRLPSGGGLMER